MVKPTHIQFTNGNVTEYINSADGMKLRTIHSTAVSGLTVPLHQTHTLTAAETMYVDSTTYSGDVEIDQGRNTKWYFGEGYVQQTPSGSATTYYTIKDYLGNIRKVMKSDGTVVQKQNYYAFGGILNETNNYTDIQTHKYNGKEYDPMHGLNEYDYGARHYDPAIGKFTTIDPLCEKYYHISPYAYCGGNPVVFFDPNGEEPTPAEAARMAAHVYGNRDKMILIGGWQVSNRDFGINLEDNNGLRSKVYERVVKGVVTEYAYVTAGTDEICDWLDNIEQPLGLSTQYHNAAENAKTLSRILKDRELSYIGHSLGGGEAVLNSLLTYGEGKGRKAFTFNAAGKSYNFARVVEGDTIIGGQTYKRICNKAGGQYQYGLREEGKKVYIVYDHYETPELLYDFSKEKGDIVTKEVYGSTIRGLRVADVDTIDIDGVKFRRMRIVDYSYDIQNPITEWHDEDIPWYASYWIEGVGSEIELESNYRLPGNYNNLMSCQINGRIYTQRELLATNIKEVEKKKEDMIGGIHNLQGQRINTLQKGFNIVDGKMVWVK